VIINPIQAVGAIAGAAVIAYGAFAIYKAGERSVQSEWDRAKLEWQVERSNYQSRIIALTSDIDQAQKGAQLQHAEEIRKFEASLVAERARAERHLAGMRDSSNQLRKWIDSKSDDSAALGQCKAVATAYEGLFGSCNQRYRELGESADRDLAKARATGLECERAYDAAEQALKVLREKGATPKL
jgi:hypothetical protein